MRIIKGGERGFYLPEHEQDLPMFRHICEGAIEVRDIEFYRPVFEAHNIAMEIQKEPRHD
jgi:hypothetical protein